MNPTMLYGEKIYLRPVCQDDLPIFTASVNNIAFLTEYNFFGLRQQNDWEKRFQLPSGALWSRRREHCL